MLWSLVLSIAVLNMSGVVSKTTTTVAPTPTPATTARPVPAPATTTANPTPTPATIETTRPTGAPETTSSPQSLPIIPNIDVSTLTDIVNNNNESDSTIILEEVDGTELTSELESIIDESSKTSKSKKDTYKSKYLLYIMSRNYKKLEYKEYVKNNKKDKIQEKFQLFIESDEYINELNANASEPIYNHTKFSDWSLEEKKSILISDEEVEEQRRRMLSSCTSFGGWGKGISSSVNYRIYAQKVQDQGGCNSCWDFASIGQYELNYLFYKGVSQKQNEQHLLECVGDSIGNCASGGQHWTTNQYLATYGSCSKYGYYLYDAEDSWTCSSCWGSLTPTSYAACISPSSTGYSKTSLDYWNTIQNAAQYVSLSFGIKISNNFYYVSSSSPVFANCDASNLIGGHAMAVYGTNGNSMLVKNSWGTDWGDNGYAWLNSTVRTSCDLHNYFSFNYW
jgi:C1A family cysteine protease